MAQIYIDAYIYIRVWGEGVFKDEYVCIYMYVCVCEGRCLRMNKMCQNAKK